MDARSQGRVPPAPGTRVHVVGLGRSGVSASLLLARLGCAVSATDLKTRGSIPAADALEQAGVLLDLGRHDPALFECADLVVVSPGVPSSTLIEAAHLRGTPVIPEVELAYRCSRASIVGVTGSNGKSTVTSMVGSILAASDRPSWTGGNLGVPLCEAVGSEADVDGGAFVVELSSFQLERIATLRCDVATILNITPDHLDRYGSFEEYADAKANIFSRQGPGDHAVVLAGEAEALARARRSRGSVHVVGAGGSGVFESGGVLRIEGLAGVTARLETGPLGLRDGLAVLNGTVAVACAILAGARPGHVIEGLSRFRPLPHRFELVAESNGIRWIDDSKATNPASVIAALEAAPGPVILVAGGLDKKLSFAGLAAAARGRVRRALLIGQAAAGLAEALEGAVEHEVAGDLATAVERAVRIARPGDCVLLSPACASFDQFRSFEHRGEEFRRLVLEALS